MLFFLKHLRDFACETIWDCHCLLFRVLKELFHVFCLSCIVAFRDRVDMPTVSYPEPEPLACVFMMSSHMCFSSWWWKYSPGSHEMVRLANCYTFSLAWFVPITTSEQRAHQSHFNLVERYDIYARFITRVIWYLLLDLILEFCFILITWYSINNA